MALASAPLPSAGGGKTPDRLGGKVTSDMRDAHAGAGRLLPLRSGTPANNEASPGEDKAHGSSFASSPCTA